MSTSPISISSLRSQLRQVLDAVARHRAIYVIERFGRPVAVLLSMEEFRALQSRQGPSNESRSPSRPSLTDRIKDLQAELRAAGHVPPSAADVDSWIETERASWGY
jgi:prevent-host-death family protein